jgi:hypothetical protein
VTTGPGASHPDRGKLKRPIAADVSPTENEACAIAFFISAPFQTVEGNAFHIPHQQKWRKIFEAARFCMDHGRNWDRASNKAKQVNFFLAKRRIMLVDSDYH